MITKCEKIHKIFITAGMNILEIFQCSIYCLLGSFLNYWFKYTGIFPKHSFFRDLENVFFFNKVQYMLKPQIITHFFRKTLLIPENRYFSQ